METLAQKLRKLLETRDVTPAALAKSCRIDRSTMFQYVHGTRPLKNQAHLEAIMNHLTLTLSERQELTESFEIEKIGYELFKRRKKIDRFIRSLPALSQKYMEKPKIVENILNASNEADGSFLPPPGYISNQTVLSQTVFSLLCKAYEKNEEIRILMQPREVSLLNLLLYPAFDQSQIKITHILCLDNFQQDCFRENLDLYYALIRYYLLLEHYNALYFYGNTKERFGMSNPFPYFICTESFVLQISSDETMGILHQDSKVIKGFLTLFSNIFNCCQPLGKTFHGLENELNYYDTYFTTELFSNNIKLCSGLCSISFLDEQLIEKYLNPMLPCIETLKPQLISYCKKLYELKRCGKTRSLINSSYVLEFIQTGKLTEYPELFFRKPFDKEDRKLFLERILKACDEGWLHLCFLDESAFPLQTRWEICATQNTINIQYFHLDTFRTLFLQEHDFVEKMYEYLESLCESKVTISEMDAVSLLKTWINEYLNE